MIHFKSNSWLAIAAALSFIQVGCEEQAAKKSEPAAEAPKPAAKPASLAKEEEAKPLTGAQLADWYGKCWDLFNTKKWDEFSKCYAEDAVATRGTDPGYALKGRSAIIEKNAKAFVAAFPDVKGERTVTLVNGNKIASMALVQGTHTGPLTGPGGTIPATNKKMGQVMLHWIEVNPKGQAIKQWEVSDSPTLMAQLGVSKDPARPAMTKAAQEPVVVVAKNDEAEAKNVAAHKQAYELFSKHDKAMFDIMADDALLVEYGMPTDIKGKKGISGFLEANWKAFSDLKIVPDEVWGAGDYTFALGHMIGTNDGDMPAMKLKKTGKKMDLRFGEVVRWENGKAKDIYPFSDNMEMAAQLGLLPPAEGAAAKATDSAAAAAAGEKAAPAASKPGEKAAAPAAKPAEKAAPTAK